MEEPRMEVVEVKSLPEKFRPTAGSPPTTNEMPAPLADLTREATSGLTAAERRAFLHRLKEEKPALFSREASGGDPPGNPSCQFSEEECREMLIRQLKKEANRFMGAAARL
ncbi:hypothetical protein [Salinibacter grassmerensis]|uniref:hypothetical protein n=1 Tax=Salinibacter grassmerensis TaxID=3040353 RepID=UPI0021E98A0D|nr:hypothetical protein [Salinibacter grassmerensis]